MSAEPVKIGDFRHTSTHKAVLTSAALAMYRVLGCERTWHTLYEIADEIVSLHERERAK